MPKEKPNYPELKKVAMPKEERKALRKLMKERAEIAIELEEKKVIEKRKDEVNASIIDIYKRNKIDTGIYLPNVGVTTVYTTTRKSVKGADLPRVLSDNGIKPSKIKKIVADVTNESESTSLRFTLAEDDDE